MPKIKLVSLNLLTLFIVLGIPILIILIFFWWLQQSNVQVLEHKIVNLENNIQTLKVTISIKSQLEPQIKNLQQQIEALPDSVTSKQKLIKQITKSRQQIEALPEFIVSKEQFLTWEKELLILEKERVNSQNAIYRSLVQALGGAFFIVTAYFTWRNTKATEDKQISERFSKAVEQLASDKVEVRLGAIYSLERIALDSTKDHWTIMEILTSFVQENSSILTFYQKSQKISVQLWFPRKEKSVIQKFDLPPISKDVQAAITVIGRRDFQKDPIKKGKILDLSSTNLTKADLAGANLERANLKNSHLEDAHFEGANLEDAHFEGANLEDAHFEGANLEDAHFQWANLKNAKFWQACVVKAYFNGADLRGADFRGSNLKQSCFNNAKIQGIRLEQAKNVPSALLK